MAQALCARIINEGRKTRVLNLQYERLARYLFYLYCVSNVFGNDSIHAERLKLLTNVEIKMSQFEYGSLNWPFTMGVLTGRYKNIRQSYTTACFNRQIAMMLGAMRPELAGNCRFSNEWMSIIAEHVKLIQNASQLTCIGISQLSNHSKLGRKTHGVP